VAPQPSARVIRRRGVEGNPTMTNEQNESLPRGPVVDAWPRPLPACTPMTGAHVHLEPLHRRHAGELFEAARGAEADWTYVSYGPFADFASLERFVAATAVMPERPTWAIRPIATGQAAGWISLMEIEPANAAIELGHIWMSPKLRRTRAATEAMFLLLCRAADDLGYRRLVWVCDSRNAASVNAATRLGFTREGTLRAHKVVKGRSRDTAIFSITAEEWPARRAAIAAWLDAGNFAPDGTARRNLASFRS
jgi:RimJ/RimL family protein N-acetyltransferase